jgi:cation/acetate symporter
MTVPTVGHLHRLYGWFFGGFVLFVLLLTVLERLGLPRPWIGFVLLTVPILLYAGIGIGSRTSDAAEYYVAGRRVPAFYNGMAIGADWMSAASFIGLAGGLYLQGYSGISGAGGLAFVMGWTGGYVLVAVFLAPYLRKFGQFTIPDFLGERYGGNVARAFGVAAALLCSFVYLVAQIYGVGLIATSVAGLDFSVGVFLGLGGILVCSFLGGMRAVTWTQVAQYIVLIVAYLVPVVWLSVKQTGVPVPQAVAGWQLQKVSERERELAANPAEQEVLLVFRQRAEVAQAKLADVPAAMRDDAARAQARLDALKASDARLSLIQAAEKTLAGLPRTVDDAQRRYTAERDVASARAQLVGGLPPHARPFAGDPNGDDNARRAFDESRRNFLALMFCLMVGTAALPHILARCYTTPTVRQARQSIAWALFFIFLLYVTAPALAVMVKLEVMNSVVGSSFARLPPWIAQWAKVDPALVTAIDINHDGILQMAELTIGQDIVVLAMPQIAGLPYVMTALVAAGGLAAALSTADGLLLTIANALSHDVYYKMIDPLAPTSRRVAISKALLLIVALAAAYIAYSVYVSKQADILFLVSAAFSLAGSAFFPALVLGIFWTRATAPGALCGMAAGLGLTLYYMVINHPWMRTLIGITQPVDLWWGIQPISAGVFGVPLGFAVIVVVSLLTGAPRRETRALVEALRWPRLPSA